MRGVAAALILIAVCATLGPPAGGGTGWPAGARLPFAGYEDMVVDPATGRIFITSDPPQKAAAGVFVFGPRGKLLRRVEGVAGAGGMSINAKTRSLYVGVAKTQRAAAIAEIDTRTLRVRRRYTLPPRVACSDSPALAGGRIWFVNCASVSAATGLLGAVDSKTGRLQLFTGSGYPVAGGPLAASPSGPLLAAATSQGVTLFDVRGGRPRALASAPGVGRDLVFFPDGARLGALAPDPNRSRLIRDRIRVFRIPTLEPVSEHDVTIGPPSAAAVSPNGRSVAGGADLGGPLTRYDVYAFARDSMYAYWRTDFGPDAMLAPRGLAFGKNSITLYAVTEVYDEDHRYLHVLDLPRPPFPTPLGPAQTSDTFRQGLRVDGAGYQPPDRYGRWSSRSTISSDRSRPVRGTITVRYYLPNLTILSVTPLGDYGIPIKTEIVPGGAVVTVTNLSAKSNVTLTFELQAKRGTSFCTRTVLTLPDGTQHEFPGGCATIP